MARPWIALVLFAVYCALAFGWRSLRQRRPGRRPPPRVDRRGEPLTPAA
ncbi:hypothetical protein [Sorangium sp. So ce1151]